MRLNPIAHPYQADATALVHEVGGGEEGALPFAEWSLLLFECRMLILRQKHYNLQTFVQRAVFDVCCPFLLSACEFHPGAHQDRPSRNYALISPATWSLQQIVLMAIPTDLQSRQC